MTKETNIWHKTLSLWKASLTCLLFSLKAGEKKRRDLKSEDKHGGLKSCEKHTHSEQVADRNRVFVKFSQQSLYRRNGDWTWPWRTEQSSDRNVKINRKEKASIKNWRPAFTEQQTPNGRSIKQNKTKRMTMRTWQED